MILQVYVPRPSTYAARQIKQGAAVVGSMDELHGRIRLDYEGNLYGSNSRSFEECLVSAAGRHVARYPTVARMWVKPADIIKVGQFDYVRGELTITDPAALAEWRGQQAAQAQGS